MEFGAGFVPELSAVDGNLGRCDAVEDDHTIVGEYGEHTIQNVLQMTAVTADEDGIRMREFFDRLFQEIADMDADACSSEATGILMDDCLALWADLKCLDMEVRKLKTCLDGDAACTETDVPEHMAAR